MELVFRRLGEADFCVLKNFYERGREALSRKEFFYPFKDDDLYNLLSGGGIAMGAFYNDKLIGASCIDCDPRYGKILFDKLNTFYPHIQQGVKVCEYSGVMTDPGFSRKGIATAIYKILFDYAKRNLAGCVLCAVVQLENIKSLSFFYGKDFRLASVGRYDGVDFGYLARDTSDSAPSKPDLDKAVEVKFLDYQSYSKYLSQGYVGVGLKDNCMLLLPLSLI